MSGIEINIEFNDLDGLYNLVDYAVKHGDKIIEEEMTTFGMLAEEASKALVHHKEGTLEDSITFDRATRQGNEYIVRGGTNIAYAWRRHEEPGRGPGTLAKPLWRGYRPGPKYMENAIKSIEKDYDVMNDRILSRLLGEKP